MTDKLLKWDVNHFWHPYTQMRWYKRVRPPIIVRASGNYLFDVNGKKYLDAVSSIWCIAFGHSEKRILNAIIRQAKKLQHSTTLGMSNVPAIVLARKLSEIVGLPKVFLSEDGAEAVEVAIKICFSYSKRTGRKRVKFCGVKNAYHGDTVGAMSVSGETVFTAEYKEIMFDVVELPSVYCFRCPFNKSNEKMNVRCSYECIEEARSVIRRHKDEICAVFVEGGVQGAGGIIPFPPGYIRSLWEETRKYDILLVLDEVATGFGRTGKMFGFQWDLGARAKPDIVCLGKALSGGYLPVAATVVSEDVYRVFDGELWEYKHFFHGHTFTGNPIACASAVENINIFQQDDVIRKIQPVIQYLERKIKRLINLDYVGDVRGRGFMWGVELVKRDKESFPRDFMAGWRVALDMWRKGIFIRPLGDVIVINPPLSIKLKEIDLIVDALEDSILKLKSST